MISPRRHLGIGTTFYLSWTNGIAGKVGQGKLYFQFESAVSFFTVLFGGRISVNGCVNAFVLHDVAIITKVNT